MVNKHIKDLLENNNRVIIPDFGAFIARVSINPDSKVETKTIVFNDILKFNDGLLVNHIIESEKADITLALQQITDFIHRVVAEFDLGNDYKIEGIGKLNRDKKGNIILQEKTETETVKEETEINAESNNDKKTKPVLSSESPVLTVNLHDEKDLIISENIVKPQLINSNEIITSHLTEVENQEPKEIAENEMNKGENMLIPPPIPISESDEKVILPPPIPTNSDSEKQEIVAPEIVVQVGKSEQIKPEIDITKSENVPNQVVVDKSEPLIESESKSEKKVIKQEGFKEKIKENQEIKKEDKKKEDIKPILSKPIVEKKKKTEVANTETKKKKWIPIVIWSASGLIFLTVLFLIAVKFNFIKGITIFPKNEWVIVNDKLLEDLHDFNKKYRDKLSLTEVSKSENNQVGQQSSEGSFGAADQSSTQGSFDAPAGTTSSQGSFDAPANQAGSQGSFDATPAKDNSQGSFDTKTEAKDQSTAKTTVLTTKNNQSPKSSGGKYILVAGSFKVREAAENFLSQLRIKGFTNAEYIGEKNGMYMISYGSFANKNEADAEANKLKQKGIQTWVSVN